MTIFSVIVLLICSLPVAILIGWWVLAKNDSPVDMHGLNAILAAREETEESAAGGRPRCAQATHPHIRQDLWEGAGRTQDSMEKIAGAL